MAPTIGTAKQKAKLAPPKKIAEGTCLNHPRCTSDLSNVFGVVGRDLSSDLSNVLIVVILGRDSLLGKKSIGSVPPHATTIMALLTTTGSVCPGILPVVDILLAWV
jgi:hypothetical protein